MVISQPDPQRVDQAVDAILATAERVAELGIDTVRTRIARHLRRACRDTDRPSAMLAAIERQLYRYLLDHPGRAAELRMALRL